MITFEATTNDTLNVNTHFTFLSLRVFLHRIGEISGAAYSDGVRFRQHPHALVIGRDHMVLVRHDVAASSLFAKTACSTIMPLRSVIGVESRAGTPVVRVASMCSAATGGGVGSVWDIEFASFGALQRMARVMGRAAKHVVFAEEFVPPRRGPSPPHTPSPPVVGGGDVLRGGPVVSVVAMADIAVYHPDLIPTPAPQQQQQHRHPETPQNVPSPQRTPASAPPTPPAQPSPHTALMARLLEDESDLEDEEPSRAVAVVEEAPSEIRQPSERAATLPAPQSTPYPPPTLCPDDTPYRAPAAPYRAPAAPAIVPPATVDPLAASPMPPRRVSSAAVIISTSPGLGATYPQGHKTPPTITLPPPAEAPPPPPPPPPPAATLTSRGVNTVAPEVAPAPRSPPRPHAIVMYAEEATVSPRPPETCERGVSPIPGVAVPTVPVDAVVEWPLPTPNFYFPESLSSSDVASKGSQRGERRPALLRRPVAKTTYAERETMRRVSAPWPEPKSPLRPMLPSEFTAWLGSLGSFLVSFQREGHTDVGSLAGLTEAELDAVMRRVGLTKLGQQMLLKAKLKHVSTPPLSYTPNV